MPSGDTPELNLLFPQRGGLAEQKLFGRYTLKRVLGRGGMGIVWLAHDEELHRNVAMKFLPDMLIRDKEAVNDLKRETRRSLDLTHHHIVRIYDFTQDDVCAAIVMEYVDGETLSAMKTQQPGGCFSVSTISAWVAHFCEALDYAHRQARVVHRDLKPANLMVNSRGDLKITDFGISRSMSDSMTRVSMSNTAGTLAYMSPEQALGAPPAACDDIYAFGATIYDLLTGRPPFFRGNIQVQLETVIPPTMGERRAELENEGEPIPELWESVIATCLAKRPQDRPQTMGDIATMLGLGGPISSFRGAFSTGSAGSGAHQPGTGSTHTATQATTGTDDAATRTDSLPRAPQTTRPASKASTATPPIRHGPRPTALRDIIPGYVDEPIPAPAPQQSVSPPPSRPEEPLIVPIPPAAPEPPALTSEPAAQVEEPQAEEIPLLADEEPEALDRPIDEGPIISDPPGLVTPPEAEVLAVPAVEEPQALPEAEDLDLPEPEAAPQMELELEEPTLRDRIPEPAIVEESFAEQPPVEEPPAAEDIEAMEAVAEPISPEPPAVEEAPPEPAPEPEAIIEEPPPPPVEEAAAISPESEPEPAPTPEPAPVLEPQPVVETSRVAAETTPSTSRVAPRFEPPSASPERKPTKSWLPIAAIAGMATVVGIWLALPKETPRQQGPVVLQTPTPVVPPTPAPIALEVDAKIKQAVADYTDKKYDEAAALLHQVQKLDPANNTAALMLDKIATSQREKAEMEARQKQVTELLSQAKTAHDREQWLDERTALQKTLQLDSTNATAKAQLADLDQADESRRLADEKRKHDQEAEVAARQKAAMEVRQQQERDAADRERERQRIAKQQKPADQPKPKPRPQRPREDTVQDTPVRQKPVVNRDNQRPPTPTPTRTESQPPKRTGPAVFKGGAPGG